MMINFASKIPWKHGCHIATSSWKRCYATTVLATARTMLGHNAMDAALSAPPLNAKIACQVFCYATFVSAMTTYRIRWIASG